MEAVKVIRSKRALVAGRSKTAMQIGRELTEQRLKHNKLTELQAREEELRKQRKSLQNGSSPNTVAPLSTKNHIARRQLQESVAQLALLDVLCHLDRINHSKIAETNSELVRCSAELERLNRVREIFNTRADRVQATAQLAVELAE